MSMYVGGERMEAVKKNRKAIPVNTSVTKDPHVLIAQGSFGTHSSTCSNCISDSEMSSKKQRV